MVKKGKRPIGLGRGLNSLLGDIQRETGVQPGSVPDNQDNAAAAPVPAPANGLRYISVADIAPNPDQPRQNFDEAALAELAASISQRGLIQPIVVRQTAEGFQIVAGERRWRAAQRAQLHQLPAIVRDFDDAETLEVAIVENVQRHDLNVIEEARAYHRLASDYGHSANSIGELVGKSRSHIANLMRLTELPDSVQAMLADNRLSMGHARALINCPEAQAIAEKAVAQGLSVRTVEQLVRQAGNAEVKVAVNKTPPRGAPEKHPDIAALERQLAELLGMAVLITDRGAESGELVIRYGNLDQLDFLCQRLTNEEL
jgi:ParB family chromosome partitioning protein